MRLTYKSQLVTLRGGVDKKFDIAADLLSSFKALTDWCIFIPLSRESVVGFALHKSTPA